MPKRSATESKATNTYQRGEVVTISRSEITDDTGLNPRKISRENADRLRRSIKEHGLVGHLVWNRANGHIIGGHQRLDQLDALMHKDDYELQVLAVDIPDPKEELSLNVALNNQDAQGEFDWELMESLVAEFKLDPMKDLDLSTAMVEINLPAYMAEMEESLVESGAAVGVVKADPAEIERMKQEKREIRQKVNEMEDEDGRDSGEQRGTLTIVFPRHSQMVNWLSSLGLPPNSYAVHVNELLKSLGLPECDFEGVDWDGSAWRSKLKAARQAAKVQNGGETATGP